MRLIDADALKKRIKQEPTDGMYTAEIVEAIDEQPTVDAAPAVRGWWEEFIHSALVSWKDGEPVLADRTVYRCSRCDFGTIAKHNYCPRCGQKMEGRNNG